MKFVAYKKMQRFSSVRFSAFVWVFWISNCFYWWVCVWFCLVLCLVFICGVCLFVVHSMLPQGEAYSFGRHLIGRNLWRMLWLWPWRWCLFRCESTFPFVGRGIARANSFEGILALKERCWQVSMYLHFCVLFFICKIYDKRSDCIMQSFFVVVFYDFCFFVFWRESVFFALSRTERRGRRERKRCSCLQ